MDSDPQDLWTDWAPHARAAIEAMREPTEAMMEAAWAVNSGDCKDDYQAAIDAALSGDHP